ncbi:MAG: serine hydrolase domain-containing protein [Pseudomonadota bacterium]
MKAFMMLSVLLLAPVPVQQERDIRDAAVPAEEFAALDTLIAEQMRKLEIPGLSLAIIRNGRVAYVRSYGVADREAGRPVQNDTLFEAASLSKVAFAYFALREVERGNIALDAPIAEIFKHPDIDDPRSLRITPRMVLSHRTGFPNWRWENEDNALDIRFEPGTEFGYSGEGFEYLAHAIARKRGTDIAGLEAIMRADLKAGLGCDTGPWTVSDANRADIAAGYIGKERQDDWAVAKPVVSASLFSTAERYGCLLAGVLNGAGLSRDLYRDMVSSQGELGADDDFRMDFGLDAWGLGVAIKQTSHGTAISHGGVNEGFTAWFTALRDQRSGYIFFTNSQKAPELNAAIEERLLAISTGVE